MMKDTSRPIRCRTTSRRASAGWSARASNVVEARFDPASLPDVLTELAVSDEPRQQAVTLQVIQRLGDGVVRCVATSPVHDAGSRDDGPERGATRSRRR